MAQDSQMVTLLYDDRWHNKVYNGGWVDGGGAGMAVVGPAAGKKLGRVGSANPQDVRAAAKRAAEAQKAWAAPNPTQRATILRSAGQLFEDHAAELQAWIMQETGAISAKADLELHVAAQECY